MIHFVAILMSVLIFYISPVSHRHKWITTNENCHSQQSSIDDIRESFICAYCWGALCGGHLGCNLQCALKHTQRHTQAHAYTDTTTHAHIHKQMHREIDTHTHTHTHTHASIAVDRHTKCYNTFSTRTPSCLTSLHNILDTKSRF